MVYFSPYVNVRMWVYFIIKCDSKCMVTGAMLHSLVIFLPVYCVDMFTVLTCLLYLPVYCVDLFTVFTCLLCQYVCCVYLFTVLTRLLYFHVYCVYLFNLLC